MTTNNFCFYLQNRLIQTSQTGGQWYSDTYPFSVPWIELKNYYYSAICFIAQGTDFCLKDEDVNKLERFVLVKSFQPDRVRPVS